MIVNFIRRLLPLLTVTGCLFATGCGWDGTDEDADAGKTVVILSESDSTVSGCLLRLLIGDNVDYLSDADGRIRLYGYSGGSGVEDAFLVADGFVCKTVKVDLSETGTDTIVLHQARLAIDDTASLFIASIPPMVFVVKDSLCIGRTNVMELYLPAGGNVLRFIKSNYIDRLDTLDLTSGKNPSRMVRLNGR